jgi:hypothetical protein
MSTFSEKEHFWPHQRYVFRPVLKRNAPVPTPPDIPDEGFEMTVQPRAEKSTCERFVVDMCGEFCGQRVVVKELRQEDLLTTGTLECFVVDVSLRVAWCHPHLVPVHGAYCERFDDADIPRLCLGMVMRDMQSPPMCFKSLQHVLFFEGRRFSVADAIDVVLQVADVVQYMLFDADEYPSALRRAWTTISPSNIFIRVTTGAAVSEEGSACDGSALRLNENVIAMYCAPLYIEHGPVNRWEPHTHAASRECYALAQLLIALLTNAQPFGSISCQVQLSAVRNPPAVDAVRCNVPHGMYIPKSLPQDFQRFLGDAMMLNDAAVSRVTGQSTSRMSMQYFRHRLTEFRAAAARPNALSEDVPERAQLEPPVDDYGLIERQPFDHHEA